MAYFYDEEYERAKETPGLSPAALERLAARRDDLKQREAALILEGTMSTRRRTADRVTALTEEAEALAQTVRETEGRLLTYRITAEEAQRVILAARKRAQELSRLAVDLRKQEATQDRIYADPVAEADRLFSRYPALQADRPSLFE